jgi:methionine aminopeptidase
MSIIRTEEELAQLRENAKIHKIVFEEIKKVAQP